MSLSKKSLKIVFFVLTVSFGFSSNAGFSVASYSASKDNDLMKMYVFGIANGILYSNHYVKGTSSGPMLCKVKQLKINEYLDMLDVEINRPDTMANDEIEKLMLQGLMNKFLCK